MNTRNKKFDQNNDSAQADNRPKLSPASLIAKKRDGQVLSKNEIQLFIDQYLQGEIADYQMSAMLMAIYLQGMDKKETAALTNTMLYSGRVLELKDAHVIDKHSTGGVGDKTSFIVAPLARACGVKVPMIAGRGLGHTGGTVDKIEAVPQFNSGLSLDEFENNLYTHGLVLMGQTEEIAPADKRMYALRDVTATVESIPLITASIMSKKLAEGARGFVFDIKAGRGAFMKDLKSARLLMKSLTETGARFKRDVLASITDMSIPLGRAIGNSLEIIECIEVLKGRGPEDLKQVSLHLAGGMVYLAGLAKTHSDGIKQVTKALHRGEGLSWFQKMITWQNGPDNLVDHYEILPIAPVKTPILAHKKGFFHKIAPIELGLFLVELGGGRKRKEDKIDHSVGIVLTKHWDEQIEKGEPIAYIYHHPHQTNQVQDFIKNSYDDIFKISSSRSPKRKLILETSIKRSFKHV
ncbi:MAG: thymidine phosphorylase [Bdellovibrio sp.]|nr:thymidine phosphorylase [Bdellovibrio sp.]